MPTFATMFSGGGGAAIGIRNAGARPLWAIEYDPAIAAVYRQNLGDHIIVDDVANVDYATLPSPDILQASTVCKEFSQAKTNGVEGVLDIASAQAVCRAIDTLTPRVFLLENVSAYHHSKSYKLICRALDLAGYMWHAEVLNSADFGVPQTRRRLILRAVKDALLPGLAAPERWRGWYEAIEDLLPGLPESAFAAWQLARLPDGLKDTALVEGTEMRGEISPIFAAHPICTVKATTYKGMPRAFLVHANDQRSMPTRGGDEPAFTIAAASHNSHAPDTKPKAWLVDGQNARSEEKGGLNIVPECEPSFTITNAHKGIGRAWLAQGRVVKMTPRALARFQSLPDSYILPDKSSLACTVIGNMVPSLMMQKIVEPLL